MDRVSAVEDGDTVFVRWRMTGTHTGAQFSGIDATGKAVELDGMDQFSLRDGKMASNFVSSTRWRSAGSSACSRPTARRPTAR